MDKKEIEKIIERHQAIADRNYQKYQETGEQRYYRAQANADDIATVARMALDAADTAMSYGALKGDIARLASKAGDALHSNEDPEAARKLLKQFWRYAVNVGLATDKWKGEIK